MRELIDMVSIYAALALGFGALWYGVFSGGEVGASIVRAALCALGALALGLVAKAVWFMAVLLGGAAERRGGKREKEAASSGGEEGGWMSPPDGHEGV